jgi:hypothetical protein
MSATRSASPAESFRSLCRSSPWRWQTLRFEFSWRQPAGSPETVPETAGAAPLKAWVRRPAALRVEAADGTLLSTTTGNEQSRDALYVSATRKSWLLAPRLVTPVYDAGGLVRRRPEAAYGEAVFGDPRWSSMLDPVEFAGDSPVPFSFPGANRVEVEDLAEDTVAGRPVLTAVLSPNPSYTPSVPGFPLIGAGRTRVGIDVGTGICVATHALDGAAAGAGHLVSILGVDDYLDDDLFLAAPEVPVDARRHVPWTVS